MFTAMPAPKVRSAISANRVDTSRPTRAIAQNGITSRRSECRPLTSHTHARLIRYAGRAATEAAKALAQPPVQSHTLLARKSRI